MRTPTADEFTGFFHGLDVIEASLAKEKGCQTARQHVRNLRAIYTDMKEKADAKLQTENDIRLHAAAQIVAAFTPSPDHPVRTRAYGECAQPDGAIADSDPVPTQRRGRGWPCLSDFAAAGGMIFFFWIMSVFFHAIDPSL